MDEREERIQTAQAGFEEAWKKLKGIPDIKAIELSEALERVKRTHVGECAIYGLGPYRSLYGGGYRSTRQQHGRGLQ